MGVSQIWTKIRDAGLMDFQGKTPRNSLSSALSAAKSKGSNSVIVYNEGLYALRKYKHKLEEGRVKNICWETLPEDDISKESPNFQWVGGSICKKGSKTYYSAIRVDGIVHRIGESAHFTSTPDERPYLGNINGFYEEDDYGAFVEVIWYFFPEDTHCGRLEEHQKNEVFMGEEKDVTSAESIESKTEVLSSIDYNKRMKQANFSIKNTYLCRSSYHWETKTFHSIKTEEDTQSTTNGDSVHPQFMNGDHHKPEKKDKRQYWRS